MWYYVKCVIDKHVLPNHYGWSHIISTASDTMQIYIQKHMKKHLQQLDKTCAVFNKSTARKAANKKRCHELNTLYKTWMHTAGS